MAMLSTLKNFDEALPGLRVAQHLGRLVPFVGAGISRPHCRSWPQFIDALYQTFGATPGGQGSGSDPESLYRTADRVAAWLRLLPADDRRARLRAALHDPVALNLPPQALALASFAWPLIITTNYDDLIPHSLYQHFRRNVRIFGRSAEHCVQVVRALDTLDDPIVWFIQGHVGSVGGFGALGEARVDRTLLEEVVVGHQQYQHAINSSQSFRRAFSEVFRRRSLLFVGSGLAESYFVNLIAETLFSLGPSGQPHFALFCDTDHPVDPDFLAVRLGITPIRYGSTYADLPGALEALAHEGAGYHRNSRLHGLTYATFRVPRLDLDSQLQDLAVSLRFGSITGPTANGCVILSVGRDKYGDRFKPGIGTQAISFLHDYEGSGHRGTTTFLDVPDLPQGRLFRLHLDGKPAPVFCLAARELDDRPDDDARSLAVITEATTQALTAVEKAGFVHVSMGLMAAGPERADEPPYCLIAQLSGVRVFAERPTVSRPGVESIEIDIVDQNVWSAIAQGRLQVLDLLASRFARVLVRVSDGEGSVEEFALSVPHESTIGDVIAAYKISDERITIAARPLPRRNAAEMRDVRVFPGMVIDVSPLA